MRGRGLKLRMNYKKCMALLSPPMRGRGLKHWRFGFKVSKRLLPPHSEARITDFRTNKAFQLQKSVLIPGTILL